MKITRSQNLIADELAIAVRATFASAQETVQTRVGRGQTTNLASLGVMWPYDGETGN